MLASSGLSLRHEAWIAPSYMQVRVFGISINSFDVDDSDTDRVTCTRLNNCQQLLSTAKAGRQQRHKQSKQCLPVIIVSFLNMIDDDGVVCYGVHARTRTCTCPRALTVFSQLYLISGVSPCVALGGVQRKEEASADETLLKE